jgi:fluoroacetyl-CoA thioesterase
MQNIFKKGDIKTYFKTVSQKDIAAFASGVVHEVYSTFCLAQDAEWCSRLFVLDMKADDEEGIGTQLTVQHISPAFVGEQVCITTTFDTITDKGEIITTYEAFVGNRLIATGVQGQRILLKSVIEKLFSKVKNSSEHKIT